MAAPPKIKPAVTLDASFVVAYCSKEPATYAKADARLTTYLANGAELFAPGTLIQESLYAFCKKVENGLLTAAEQALAVQNLIALISVVKPPPTGDSSLIARSEQIRNSFGCSRSADSVYLALAEQLAAYGPAELVTFDPGIPNQARINAPTVAVSYLG